MELKLSLLIIHRCGVPVSVIETNRLVCHRPTKDDSLTLENLWRNDNVREFLGGLHHAPI